MNLKLKVFSALIASALTFGCDSTSELPAKQPLAESQDKELDVKALKIPLGALIPFSDTIPHPSEMNVEVIAGGRVSTLKNVDVIKVGKNIPYTYSWGRVNNTPGFDWYVSKHFALKSNRPEDQVLLYIELLEMSFPHYIELFGMTPPDLENKRMAAVYGSSKKDTQIFVPDDNITRGISAGGEAMFYNLVGYSFPSAREQHQRYIVVHEQGHVFQMSLMDYPGWLPTWFTEGTADALAHHYYDPDMKQLKVMVFDRASPMDYIRRGLIEYKKLNSPTIQDMTNNPRLYRGINFLIVHFMLDDPDRSHKFKAYRDEMSAMRKSDYGSGKALSHELMVGIFGDWKNVEQEFSEFVASVDKTFNTAAGPWEQDGNQLWVRVLNNKYEQGSPRMDVLLKPGNQPFYNQFKFDQPIVERSPLALKPARGIDNPVVSMKVDYLPDHLHRGHVGIGLGLSVGEENQKRIEADKSTGTFDQKSYKPDEDELLRIKVVEGKTLVIDGSSLAAEIVKYSLSPKLVEELEAQKNPTLGLSVTINKAHLEVIIKTEANQQTERYLLSENLRQLLLQRNMSILAENAEHRLTAYFDEGRELNPVSRDITKNMAVNPWANPADKSISRLFRATWRLGDKAPQLLKDLYQSMVDATPKDHQTQLNSLEEFKQAIPSLVEAIVASGADAKIINQALVELSGLHFRMEWRQENDKGEQVVSAVLRNQGITPADGKLEITQQGNATHSKSEELLPGTRSFQDLLTTLDSRNSQNMIISKATVKWEGQTIILTDEADSKVYPWSSMAIVEEAKLVDQHLTITSEFRGPHAGKTKGTIMLQAYPSDIFEQAYIEEEVSIKPYEVRQFVNRFKLKEGMDKKPYAVDVSFKLVIDGEPVLLSKRSEVK